jgi:2',3'-cyclic-nucleotide 2'-phosphodiesterase (5'-nucleotidase family)
MNIRWLILPLLLLLLSCVTVEKTQTYQYQNMEVTAISDTLSDPEFMRILQPYKDEIEHIMAEKIAVSDVPMKNGRPESVLSNFASDLVLRVLTNYCHENKLDFAPDLAIVNTGSLRASLPEGDITVEHVFQLMPFENQLVLVRITGKQLIELTHYIASRDGEGVSGITFGIRNSQADSIRVNGMMIDEQKQYWIATSDYVANGGDGMKVLTWADKRIDTGLLIRDAIIADLKEHTKQGKHITAKTDGRVYHAE